VLVYHVGMTDEKRAEARPMLVECLDCEKPVIGDPCGYVIWRPDDDVPSGRFTLLACRDQGHPLLVLQVDYGDDGRFDDDDPIRVYPPRDPPLSSEVPEQLRQIHEEARRCFHARAYTAVAVMSGRTLEGACALHGVKGNNLQSSLAKMKELGLIDGRLWEWAQTLRGVRNSAAHFNNDMIARRDAEDALAFNEALLDNLYVLNARFTALKERRAKNAESGK
jgi:hypothetical protein